MAPPASGLATPVKKKAQTIFEVAAPVDLRARKRFNTNGLPCIAECFEVLSKAYAQAYTRMAAFRVSSAHLWDIAATLFGRAGVHRLSSIIHLANVIFGAIAKVPIS
jgi:hypothetical protein